jgi:hypothetical protein
MDRQMKLGKKALIALTFTVGACLFVATALADIALGTGYDRLKDAIKRTAAQMENGLESYTLRARTLMRIDDFVLYENVSTERFDLENRARELFDETTHGIENVKRSSHTYHDPHLYVWKRAGQDNYQGYAYPNGDHEWRMYTNPFEEEGAEDLEKIIDALVGNLKDHVIIEDRADGGQVFRGNLNEVQVPALVNAVLSFYVKHVMLAEIRFRTDMDEQLFPKIIRDVYVKRIGGRAEESKRGLVETFQGEIVLSGADDGGERHEISVFYEIKVTDIGQTRVERPDLTNAQIETIRDSKLERHRFSKKHIGTYRSDIIVETPDAFVKIGERTLTIASVDDEKITGTYTETIYPEYAGQYELEPITIPFVTEQIDWQTVFKYRNHDGEERYAEIEPGEPGKVYLYMDWIYTDETFIYPETYDQIRDTRFIRIFE